MDPQLQPLLDAFTQSLAPNPVRKHTVIERLLFPEHPAKPTGSCSFSSP
jgi:hypothetical protein